MIFSLLGYSVTDAWLIAKAVELAVLSVATFFATNIFPKFPFWFDDWIDQFFKLDFEQRMKEELSRIIRWLIHLTALYLAFRTLEVPNIIGNRLYQLIVLYYGTRITLAILRPSIRRIDTSVNGGKTSVHNSKMLENFVSYTVYAVALIMSMSILGYAEFFTALLASAGIVGIVVGLAAKDFVSNTLAGVSIAFDRPIMYGEIVEIGGQVGKVEEIGLRMLQLKTLDNKVVMIPNYLVYSGPVVNYTRKNTRSIDIPIGIAYESDLQKAMDVLSKVPEKVNGAITDNKDKPVQVLVSGFGASSVDLILRFWINIRKSDLIKAGTEAKILSYESLVKEGIEIPYPKHVVITGNRSSVKPAKKGRQKHNKVQKP